MSCTLVYVNYSYHELIKKGKKYEKNYSQTPQFRKTFIFRYSS